MWYWPGAFGSFIGVDEFASFQVPFESQFQGLSGASGKINSQNIAQDLAKVIIFF